MLKMTGFVLALCLARGAFGFQFQSVANLGPELAARFGLDYTSLGALVGAYMLPGIVAALPGGMLGRRFGDRVVVGAGLALMTAGALVASAWFTPGGIWAGRVVAGTGAVALIVLQGKMVADRFTGPTFMTVMGLLVGAFPIGVGLVGLSHDGARAALGPAGLLVLGAVPAALALLLFVPAAPTRLPASRRISSDPTFFSRLMRVIGLPASSMSGAIMEPERSSANMISRPVAGSAGVADPVAGEPADQPPIRPSSAG